MYLVALGANLASPLGGPRVTLQAAVRRLGEMGLVCEALARWHRSPAFPPGSGPDYVNGAARLASDLDPHAVLAALHRVEAEFGRARAARWGARCCDLDLLAHDGAVLPDAATVRRWMALDAAAQMGAAPAQLILPHPRLHQRGFVLRPLAEVAAAWVHPLTGLNVAGMLDALPREALAGVEPI